MTDDFQPYRGYSQLAYYDWEKGNAFIEYVRMKVVRGPNYVKCSQWYHFIKQDWSIMPSLAREEVMKLDRIIGISCTRAFPHIWKFHGMKDEEEWKIAFSGPPFEFLDPVDNLQYLRTHTESVKKSSKGLCKWHGSNCHLHEQERKKLEEIMGRPAFFSGHAGICGRD